RPPWTKAWRALRPACGPIRQTQPQPRRSPGGHLPGFLLEPYQPDRRWPDFAPRRSGHSGYQQILQLLTSLPSFTSVEFGEFESLRSLSTTEPSELSERSEHSELSKLAGLFAFELSLPFLRISLQAFLGILAFEQPLQQLALNCKGFGLRYFQAGLHGSL